MTRSTGYHRRSVLFVASRVSSIFVVTSQFIHKPSPLSNVSRNFWFESVPSAVYESIFYHNIGRFWITQKNALDRSLSSIKYICCLYGNLSYQEIALLNISFARVKIVKLYHWQNLYGTLRWLRYVSECSKPSSPLGNVRSLSLSIIRCNSSTWSISFCFPTSKSAENVCTLHGGSLRKRWRDMIK